MFVRKPSIARHLLKQIQHITRFYVMNSPHFLDVLACLQQASRTTDYVLQLI